MTRQKWLMVAAAVLIAVVGVLFTGRPTPAQPGAAPPAAPGRYQMQTTGAAPNSTVFVLDTQTGQVWYRQTIPDVPWTDMGTPTVKVDGITVGGTKVRGQGKA